MATNAYLSNLTATADARRAERQAEREARAAELAQRRTERRAGINAMTTPSGPSSASGFNAFYNTPLYQVPLQEGLEAVNAMYAGRGQLESGAAMKGISDFGAGHASGALRDYFSLLGNQQAIGFNAAAGQAGAAQSYANSIQGQNTNYANALTGLNQAYAGGVGNALGGLGAAQQQGAINTGNILSQQAIAQANNNNAMWGGIGSALGGAAGYLAYRPYGG